jgi:glycosyltransferase involved in cell wall biosynthesis
MIFPLVSLLMSVYNDEKYISSTIESVLSQTYGNFEFLIINDGSTDRSADIINSYSDNRIRYIENENNIGLTASLIKGFNLAKGRFLARIDSNDICYPKRLEKQVQFLLQNSNIAVCGSSFFVFGDLLVPKKIKYPENHKLINSHLLFNSALPHVTVMLDINKFREAGLNYDPEFKAAQDYDLWYRVSKELELANMPDCLVKIRYLKSGISSGGKSTTQSIYAEKIRKRILEDIRIRFSNEEFDTHTLICLHKTDGTPYFFMKAFNWIKKLQEHNNNYGYYDKNTFNLVLEEYWFLLCKYSGFGIKYFRYYHRMEIIKDYKPNMYKKLDLLWSCLILNFVRMILKK